jgi:hypothetical protein
MIGKVVSMKTVLAYVLVIPLVPFALTFGEMLGGAVGILSSWMPDKSGAQVRGFIAGCFGSIIGVSYGFVVFRLLVGADSFSIFPFLTAVLPLSIPISNDYGLYRKFKEKAANETDVYLKTERNIVAAGASMMVLGELVGFIISGCVFINR